MNRKETDLSLLIQLDEICVEYERRFAQGKEPRIEDFLDRVQQEHCSKLLHELVKLEVSLRHERGESLSADTFVDRYANFLPDNDAREALRSTIQQALDSTANKQGPLLSRTSPMRGLRTELSADAAFPSIEGFEIDSVLGRGGMGIVYRAVQTSLNRPVALKMILDHAAASDEYVDRFEKEARAVAELNDPRFVQIYDFGISDGRPYMALELVEGGSLEEVRQNEPQAVDFSARTVEILARAMQAAHSAKLVHRDLKPHNVLIDHDGTPKITDFGLIKRQDQETEMTEHGRVMGTASYMAPEQSRGSADVGPAADLHSLGGILYCLLTGRPPFLASTAYDTILQVRNDAPVAPSQLRRDVPRDLETICLKCLQKETHKRYASAADLADDLRRYLEGRPIIARPVSATERSWRWAKRNPWVAGLGTSVAVLLVAIATVSSGMLWWLAIVNGELQEKTGVAEHRATEATIARDDAEIAQTNAEKAEKTKTDQLFLSLDMVRDLFTKIYTKLRDSPAEFELQQQIIELTKPSLVMIAAQEEDNPLVGRTQAMFWQRLGDVSRAGGLVAQAAVQFDRTRGIVEELATENPNDPAHQWNLAVIVNKLAEVHRRLGNTIRSRDFYQLGLEYYTRWSEMRPRRIVGQRRVAEAHGLLGRINFILGDPQTALKSYENSRVQWKKLPLEVLRLATVFRQLGDLEQRLGETHYQLGSDAEAERFLLRALVKRESMLKSKRTSGRVDDLCRIRLALGDFYLAGQRDAKKAWAQYKPALVDFEQLLEADKEDARRCTAVAAVEYRLGATLLRAGQWDVRLDGVASDDAQRHFERSRELRDGLAQIDPANMEAKIQWALALARCGQAAQAEAVADELVANGKANPRLLSQAAATFALCRDDDDDQLNDRCRKKAIQTLKQCIEAGWKDAVALRDDPDFDPIRSDPAFAQLHQDLQASAAGTPDTSARNAR